MTTGKVQSRIKSLTNIIILLAVLLSLAIASTVLLAAFTLNKKATTNITFGGGLLITADGIYTSTGGADQGAAGQNFVWGLTYDGIRNNLGSVENVNREVKFEAINLKIAPNSSVKEAYVVAYANIKGTGDHPLSDFTNRLVVNTSEWASIGNGWYLLGSNSNSPTALTTEPVNFVPTSEAILVDNGFAGKSIQAVFKIHALDVTAYSGNPSGALAALKNLISSEE